MKYSIPEKKLSGVKVSQRRYRSQGFTLVELMITLAITGILAAGVINSYRDYIVRAQMTDLAAQFGAYQRVFDGFKEINGFYPQDATMGQTPSNANGINIDLARWQTPTFAGGLWNWEGPDNHSYAGIAISGASATEEEMIQLDAILDNGDLTTGRFRRIGSDYTYIIDE